MPEILGKAKTVRELLKGVKYSIDYYQREYKWQEKQISELLTDLTEKFFEKFDVNHERKEVKSYPHYFLGSIIISRKDSGSYVVDGQQRLTSLTLLLLYLRNLQQGRPDQVNVDELIFSERFGEKSFNLDVPERTPCMEALFSGESPDPTEQPESVQNLVYRYQDMEKNFPEEIRNGSLPFFTDWLLENVHLVEITAESDEDAYTIFETMNDRGLSLSPTDMLKGYLLASISDVQKRTTANALWKKRIAELATAEKDADADCFKTWLRSQYANSIRERKRGATPQDFDRIGTEFHRWLREHAEEIGLRKSEDFFNFIYRNFDFFSRQYLLLIKASFELVPRLEHVLYNHDHGFTLQYLLLLSALEMNDPEEVVIEKLSLVARFVDILLAWRIWNGRSITYSTMSYAMYLVMREIRGLDVESLAQCLQNTLAKEQETFESDECLRLHQQNRRAVHRVLARITDFVETGCKNSSRYRDFVADTGKNRYEIEHIWANKRERYRDEFSDRTEFSEYRNRIGGLLLLPKSFNASYGDLAYAKKLPHYNTQKEVLARSLSPECYGKHNPAFQNFLKKTDLHFEPSKEFHRAELDARSELYREIARCIWNPVGLVPRGHV